MDLDYMSIYRARLLSARLEGGKSEIEEAVKAVAEASFNHGLDKASREVPELTMHRKIVAMRIE